MVPAPVKEDYYMILEVAQTATPDAITRSYKRLALKLHPDRNANHDATQAFQQLGRAYDTLKDESKRRVYDNLIYPSIAGSRPSPQTTQTPCPPPSSTPQSEALSEAAQISALQKSKQEREARWRIKKSVFDSSIFGLQRDILQLEQEIKKLESIIAAEAAEEVQKKSWGAWLLSPIYKKGEDSEEEKGRKERARQERRIEKDMKERRLGLKNADLKKEESQLRKAKEEVDAANRVDDAKIRVIQERRWAREFWERQERERVERERIEKMWKQQQEEREKREREAAEALRRQQAEERAAEQKRQEEIIKDTWHKIMDDKAKKYREQYFHPNLPERFFTAEGSTRHASASTCRHDGWWLKVQGRALCPECSESWTYLLECPSCKMQACPRCQAGLRSRIPHNTTRPGRRAPPRVRTSSADFFYDGW